MTANHRKETSKPALKALALVALMAIGCSEANASQGETGPTPTTESQHMQDIESLKRAEQTWVDSLTKGDAKLLATIIDDEFRFIGPDGQVEEREAYLAGYEALPQLGVVVEGVDLSELQFRVLEEVGIVTGRAVARVKMQDQPIVEDVRFTRIYRRTSTGWQMMAGQGTRVADH
jgi:ketosteroid isomerase-like protein